MKKLVVGVIVGGVLLLGVVGIAILPSLSNPWLDGEKEAVKRGDLVIPVTASGTIAPEDFIQIKSKASGLITKIHVIPGQRVEEGEILVELDPVDEKRNLEAREADVKRAESVLEKARISQTNMEIEPPLQTALARERVAEAKARLADAKWDVDRLKERLSLEAASEIEVFKAETAHSLALTALEMAETELKRAQNNEKILLRNAREDVVQAQAALETAQKARDEAKLRLDETTVRARKCGLVYNIMVSEGQTIQSGTQSLTGGTPLITLADTSGMFVIAQVDEADIGEIRAISPEYAIPGRTQKLERAMYEEKAREVIQGTDGSDAGDAGRVDGNSEPDPALKEAVAEAEERVLGRPVEVTVEAFKDETYHGVIERIEPEPQVINNVVTFRVRIRLVGDNLEKLLVSQPEGHDLEKLLALQADLSFTTAKVENVLLVKNEALFSEGRECFVYLPKRDSPRARWGEEKRMVKIGRTDGTYTHVIQGLNDNDEVWVKRPKLTEKEQEQQNSG